MKKVTLQQLAARIKRNNRAFEMATPDEKRVIIAKDCIARILMEQIKADTEGFLDLGRTDFSIYRDDDLRDLLNKQGITCVGCAKGALFLSAVGRADNFRTSEYKHDYLSGNNPDSPQTKKLLEFFSLEQLGLIEYAFEGYYYLGDYNGIGGEGVVEFKTKEEEDLYDNFSSNFTSKNDTLVAICENIIENKGIFKL